MPIYTIEFTTAVTLSADVETANLEEAEELASRANRTLPGLPTPARDQMPPALQGRVYSVDSTRWTIGGVVEAPDSVQPHYADPFSDEIIDITRVEHPTI